MATLKYQPSSSSHPLRRATRLGAGLTVAYEEQLDAATWADIAARVRPALRFLALGWWQAWADAMLPYESWCRPFRFLVARDGSGQVQAVLPVARQIMPGRLSVLSLAGNYKPFRSLLIAEAAPEETAPALVRFLKEEAKTRAFRMGPVESGQPEIGALMRAFENAGWYRCLINRGADHLIDLPSDLDVYQGQLSKKRRQRLDAQRRRLDREGEVRIERHRGLAAAAWDPVIAKLGMVENASWLARKGGDLTFANPRQVAFWRRYIDREAAGWTFSSWIMTLDDKPVAFNVALDSGDHRYGLFSHYDEALRTYSPGNILHAEIIASCFEDGLRHINLGQGDSGNKTKLGANRTEPLEDWMMMPPTAAGRVLHLAACAKFRASIGKEG